MPLTLETSQILPFAGVVLSIAWHAAKRPQYVRGSDLDNLHLFPFTTQILTGLTWLSYAVNQTDVFIYLQNIPTLVTAITITLQYHPYQRKRIRRSHETYIAIVLSLFLVVSVATSVSGYIPPTVSRISLGAMAGLATLVQAAAMLRESIRSFSSDVAPPVIDIAVAILGVLFGGVWTAYGFYGSQDPFVYVSNWAALSILQLIIVSIVTIRHGGLELGWDTEDEENMDDDGTVNRLNRASTISSMGSIKRPRSLNRSGNNRGSYEVEPTVMSSMHQASMMQQQQQQQQQQQRYAYNGGSDEEMGNVEHAGEPGRR
ncbi:hypothetical protein HDU76_006555 [Blyttiomyces sp. JEL0837]|nr:hypothetical protein HDU76_006555 [Blyttiomyces sp. JEL0837]